jgi:hypothetical protein
MPLLDSVGLEESVPVTVKIKSIPDPSASGKFIYDLTTMSADITDPDRIKTITGNFKPGETAGGSSSHSSRGGRSRKGKKSKGGKSRKARKSLRRK